MSEAAATVEADADAIGKAIVALLEPLDRYRQCRVTLFVRTPDAASDILILSDDPARLLAALQRRLGQSPPAEARTRRGPLL